MYANQGTLVPAYSSLSDPYCAKFVQKLYNVPAFDEPAEDEGDLDFYKRREETSLSNKFINARRSSCAMHEARPNGPESKHDFYKRREEEGSNAFQRARRRSIELIEQVNNDATAPTAASRRKSVACHAPVAQGGRVSEDSLMDHAAAAREATRRFNEKNQGKGAKALEQYPALVHVDSMLDPPSSGSLQPSDGLYKQSTPLRSMSTMA
jgi:hypothetical protein